MYSPSLKNVGWIEDAQLIFLIFPDICLYSNFFYRAAPSTLPKFHSRASLVKAVIQFPLFHKV